MANCEEIRPLPLLFLATFLLLAYCTKGDIHCGLCGKTPVPYPLSTGPNCGDQSYKIKCNSNTSTLYFISKVSVPYAITSVDPKAQRMVIRPPNVLPNTCFSEDYSTEGFQIDDSTPFNITSSNTLLLMNCTDNLLHLQVPINCSTNCLCHTYTDNTPSAAACKKQSLCCSLRTGGSQNAYVVRVHANGCMAYQSYVNLDPALPFAKWPPPGLELMWAAPPEPLCKTTLDCRDLPFSKCLPDPINGGLKRCLCEKGRYWDLASGYCQKCRNGTGCKFHKNQTPVIGSATGVVLLVALAGFLVYRQRQYMKHVARKTLIKEREDILNANSSGKSAKVFSGKEIRKATADFTKENMLGSGGFGEVFKGTLEDGTEIAVKRPKPGNTKGDALVLNEVQILCQVNHRSLVRLLGCCVELEEPLLVYEYVPNGTLFEHLHRKRGPLSWLKRLIIAHQTADGLAYLHSSAEPPIYHRDVKTSNILLDENLDAKVSDFGLSRLVELAERDCTHIQTSAQGTLGYLDPEYYLNLQLTDRSDVYSFGVVLLELLTSEKAIDFNREEENVNLVVYMKRVLEGGKLMAVIDPELREGATEVELETMKAVGDLAAACLDERRQNRPSMKEVADEIDCIISIITCDASKT
ncbi:wall-associated receptor kinase-like 20 [Phtheirospermum japonicum]|uniref:Wall-associated receptor kinase-like 20 n=1 Tax=Phtheirospermum japonicum TaxID=374723 RepID=A0A830CTX5_9LAMI|nr:wall-associated receptor kinase-like 20 [Phtheirospermum japonicum]